MKTQCDMGGTFAEMGEGYNEIGVVSDTHGLVRPEVLAHLSDCDAVVHAGDIGRSTVLDTLRGIGPIFAVRGNVDREPWGEALPEALELKLAERTVWVLHDLAALQRDPSAAGCALVISGHSHVPRCRVKDGVCYLNPGSIGPRRFKLPIAWARLNVAGGRIVVRSFRLEDGEVVEVNPWEASN